MSVTRSPQSLIDAQLQSRNLPTNAIETCPRDRALSTATLVSGAQYWSFFTPVKNFTVSQMTLFCNSIAAASVTTIQMGLYSFDETTATLLTSTPNDTSLFAATNTLYTKAFDSSYTVEAGKRYGASFLIVATTMPNTIGYPIGSVTINAQPPRINGRLQSQTSLAATNTSFDSSTTIWSRLS